MIKVEDLSYSFNDFPLLENLNFEVNTSEIIHLKGKNGSGKSTLLKILSGILNNFQGKVLSTAKNVFFLGHNLGLKESLPRQIMIFQKPKLDRAIHLCNLH